MGTVPAALHNREVAVRIRAAATIDRRPFRRVDRAQADRPPAGRDVRCDQSCQLVSPPTLATKVRVSGRLHDGEKETMSHVDDRTNKPKV
jgi:hypothetical protein